MDAFSEEFVESFHTKWTESGHRIREQINDDKYLVKLLRHILPSYIGKDLTLYRGENLQRWEKKKIGLCWSTSKKTAKMFGHGLNSSPYGGLLLQCECDKNWIIAEPSNHSHYLGENEFTVDPNMLENIKVLEHYKPGH